LELLIESDTVPGHLLTPLIEETNELIAIFIASAKTAKKHKRE